MREGKEGGIVEGQIMEEGRRKKGRKEGAWMEGGKERS